MLDFYPASIVELKNRLQLFRINTTVPLFLSHLRIAQHYSEGVPG